MRFIARTTVAPLTLALLIGGCAYFKNQSSTFEDAQAAQAAGDEAKAEQLYREAMREKRGDREEAKRALVSLLLQKAARISKDKPDDAMAIYRDVLMMVPESDEARIAYGRALMNVERFTEAIDVLRENSKCKGCKSLISVIFIQRGQKGLEEGEFADALTDFDAAYEMNRDPMTVLFKVDAYTKGAYGKADDAIASLDRAQRLILPEQTGVQQVWYEKRTEVIYWAAMRGEHEAIGQALMLEDPRYKVDAQQKVIDQLNLQMYAASLQIYAKAFEEGTARGLQTWQQAEQALQGEAQKALRETLLGLFAQRVMVHLSEGDESAARKIVAQGLEIDPNHRILALQNVIVTAIKNSGNARKLLDEWTDDPEYNRMRALVETAYAAKMMEIGQFTAARGAVEKAERFDPNLLETRLARAELQAETRLEDLRKTWAENFREIATYNYPGGRINYYAQALGDLRAVQKMFDEAAQRDPLRGPKVGQRIEALEKKIKAFYPFEAEKISEDKAILVLTRIDRGAAEIEVQGPRQVHKVAIPENGKTELVLEGPGYVIVNTPGGEKKALFAEPFTKITVDL